jgi:hypothetical protein
VRIYWRNNAYWTGAGVEMNTDTEFKAHIVTAMDTKLRCHACGALVHSTRVCTKKGRNAWRMSSLGNREVGTRPIATRVQVGVMNPLQF